MAKQIGQSRSVEAGVPESATAIVMTGEPRVTKGSSCWCQPNANAWNRTAKLARSAVIRRGARPVVPIRSPLWKLNRTAISDPPGERGPWFRATGSPRPVRIE